jgi:hypothetical protein
MIPLSRSSPISGGTNAPLQHENSRGFRHCTRHCRTRLQPDHRSRQPPRNTLADYDPGLVKKIHAFGPLFSDTIPRTNTETAAPHDFVEDLLVPDGTNVRVLVKAPAPANPAKILKVAPIASGQTPNEYFATAITQAISGGYAQLVFPKATYNFVAPIPKGASHVVIKSAKDLVIDGQGSTLNFASPLSGGVSIGNSERVAFKRFDLDWPKTLMASIGTIVSINNKANTMRVRIAPQYPVEAATQIIALTPWDAKSDPPTHTSP